MSVNVTVAVPLEAVAAIKGGDPRSKSDALSVTSRAVVAAVLALPYDIKAIEESRETAKDEGGEKSAAFARSQSHLDDTFTVTVIHRSDTKPDAVIRVHGSTTVLQLVQLVEATTKVSKYSQYLVFDHK
jgi:outer membrane murein-binding lipoprotein Lpp